MNINYELKSKLFIIILWYFHFIFFKYQFIHHMSLIKNKYINYNYMIILCRKMYKNIRLVFKLQFQYMVKIK